MNYELLSKLYYKDKETFEAEYKKRKEGEYSVSLGLDIHDHEAFFVLIPEFINITTRIYKKFSKLSILCMEVPQVAYKAYEIKCLIDEIILSNEIEGIHSTRKEVLDVLYDEKQESRKKRFEGMILKYALLLADKPDIAAPGLSKDVRALYDEIVLDEIKESDLPDGAIFRKDAASVVSATQQVKHVGLMLEEKIIHYIDKTLMLLKDDDIPMICRIAILHYMIGYVHPFYDGNGRLSRFISSSLLKEEFNSLVALRLSYTIKENKKDYYKAFDNANDAHNMGDLTPFILYFVDVIEKSMDSLLERLTDGKEKLDYYEELIYQKYAGLDAKVQKKTADVLWLLVQNELFAVEPFSRKTLAKELRVNAETASSYVESLAAAGAPVEILKDGRKDVYKLDLMRLAEFLERE